MNQYIRHRRLISILSLLGILCCNLLSVLATHTFRDTQGQILQADFISADAENVTVRRSSDFRIFKIPLTTLSEEDREFVKTQFAEKSALEKVKSPQPKEIENSSKKTLIPKTVSIRDYEAEVIDEDTKTGRFAYKSNHFEFHSNVKLAKGVIKDFSAIFENTLSAVDQFPIKLNPVFAKEKLYQTQLFETKEQYYADGGLAGSGGSYFPEKKKILIPLSSLGVKKASSTYVVDKSKEDNDTLIHEITHQVMHQWLGKLPIWMAEGFAEYFSNIPYERNTFYFYKFKLKDALKSPAKLRSFATILSLDYQQWSEDLASNPKTSHLNYQSAWIYIVYFISMDGEGDGALLNNYLRALENGVSQKEAEAILLDGRSHDELQKNIIKALNRSGIKVDVVR